MLDQDTRTTVLRLAEQGQGARKIAAALSISRNAVRRVLRSGQAEVSGLARAERLAPHVDRVRELHESCSGNLVRVGEELRAEGVEVAYSTLTAACRRHGIGVVTKAPAGRYHFEPGEEMQHDTSPHSVVIAGVRRVVQCASLVLCFCRMIFAQVFARWSRFECRCFLSDGIVHVGGACSRCMLDNSSVVIGRGTGSEAVPAAEMQALAQRFGFAFRAHAVGHANRSARVERPFHYIENNFYPGRTFESLDDLNAQLLAWCEQVNQRFKRHIRAVPRDLFAIERPHLRPLPLHVPEVHDVHSRRVDVEGYVSLHVNRYSVPDALIGRRVELRESLRLVRVFDGKRQVAEHPRQESGAGKRITCQEHRRLGAWKKRTPAPLPEEPRLRAIDPAMAQLVDLLRERHGGRAVRAVRQLHRMYLEYPTPSLVDAVREAVRHGLCDLQRIERMVLERIAGDYFRLPLRGGSSEDARP
jgi:hypothetical protein